MYKVEIKNHTDEETGDNYRAIFVDDQLFDWGMDSESLKVAKSLCKREPLMKKTVMGDLQTHLVQCFSEFIGKEITLKEINEALRTGQL